MNKTIVKKCANCYWCRQKEDNSHPGCYANEKWKKWIPKKQLDIPNDCTDWKEDRVLTGKEIRSIYLKVKRRVTWPRWKKILLFWLVRDN